MNPITQLNQYMIRLVIKQTFQLKQPFVHVPIPLLIYQNINCENIEEDKEDTPA